MSTAAETIRELSRMVSEQPVQPEQAPVGRFAKFTDGIWREVTDGSAGIPLYTTPQQPEVLGHNGWGFPIESPPAQPQQRKPPTA